VSTSVWWVPGMFGDSSHLGDLPASGDTLIDWREYADDLDLSAAARGLAAKALASGQRPHLVGYSMGGRLALHVALVAPGAFRTVTAVSAHPGFLQANQQQQRREEDQRWANRLRDGDLAQFWRDWNARGVLKTSAPLPLPATLSEERSLWARMLVNFGTGTQSDLAEALRTHQACIAAMVGENDSDYVQHNLRWPASIRRYQIPGAGHRALLDNPAGFQKCWHTFLKESGHE